VLLDEERLLDGQEDPPDDQQRKRVGFVRLRNATAATKAVENLHQKKVGDGDLVEECVISCLRWHLHAWSCGDYLVSIFIDQLPLAKRPIAGPGPEDRELFVRNLPLQDMNHAQLQEYFEGFGEVQDLYLIRDGCTNEPTSEGYVRFKQHGDAVRCIEALTPEQDGEAEPTDLVGQWSESERMLQRKGNCYRFNLVSEIVGAEGAGLARMKSDAKLKCLWVLGESLQQKDKYAPPALAKQLHFVARCNEDSNVPLFRERLEKAFQAMHKRVLGRIKKRKKRVTGSEPADEDPPAKLRAGSEKKQKTAEAVDTAPAKGTDASAQENTSPAKTKDPTPATAATTAVAGNENRPWQPPTGPPPGSGPPGWVGWRPPPMPGMPPGPCPPMMGGPFGYYPPPATWGQMSGHPLPRPPSVFEQAGQSTAPKAASEGAKSRSRRRKSHRGKGDRDRRKKKKHRKRKDESKSSSVDEASSQAKKRRRRKAVSKSSSAKEESDAGSDGGESS